MYHSRGLNRAKFARQWKVKLAVLLAKEGANAAVRRKHACAASQAALDWEGDYGADEATVAPRPMGGGEFLPPGSAGGW